MTKYSKNVRPLQRLSYKEKIYNKNEWGKANVDYHINISSFGNVTSTGDRDIQLLYDLYNNKFPDKWFNYVINPLNSTKDEYKNFPARIRPYTILRPNIDLFLGEYSKRSHNYRVINASESAYNSFEEERKKQLSDNINQHFINEANAKGVDTGQPTQEVPTPQALLDKLLSSYKDIRAMMGQDALTIIEEEESLREIFADLVKDWVIAGETYSYKGITLSELDYGRVSPLDIDYDKSIGTKYIEDGEWATRRMYWTISDVVDKWYNELKNQDLDQIEGNTAATTSTMRTPHSFMDRFSAYNREEMRNKIEVLHVVWKSKRKIGILTYPDPLTGEPQETEVDEDYKVDKDLGESVEWMWTNEIWEGFRLDGSIYIGIQPIPVQRNEMNNFSKCKLPYNGKRFSDTHSENISILEMGIPYQVMHIILKYRLEMTINKHKGALALIDKNVIPNKPGWDEEKFLYYAEALGYMFIDRNQIGADKSFNQYQVLNLDFFKYIQEMLKLIEANKAEWDEVLGINPYRKGQTQASDAVGNVQQGIFQSSIISESTYNSFDDFVKREYKGLLDYSKFAWVDGKKKVWRRDDLSTHVINIDPEDYCETEYDVFVVNSAQETEDLKMLKGTVQALAQNKAKPSVIAEVIRAKNFSKVTNLLKQMEAMEQQLAEQTEANKAKVEQEKLMITQQFEQIRHDFAIDLQERKYDREERLAEVKGEYQIMSSSVNREGGEAGEEGIMNVDALQDRELDREKHYNEFSLKNRELNIKEKELEDKNKQANKKAEVEKYKADKTLEVAKENKTKAEAGGSKK